MDLGQKIYAGAYKKKVVSVNTFRNSFKDGAVSSNAILYAIKNNLIDYVKLDDKINLIVLTERTLAYTPNKSPKRIK